MIFKNRYIPIFLNIGAQIFFTVCVVCAGILYVDKIITFPHLLLIELFAIIAFVPSRHDFNLKLKKLNEPIPVVPLKIDGSPTPSILYLLKEGFITAQVSEKRWNSECGRFAYKVDIRLDPLCPSLKVGRSSDGHATISYTDGSGELKITNEVLERLKAES